MLAAFFLLRREKSHSWSQTLLEIPSEGKVESLTEMEDG